MPGIKRNYPRYASIVSFMEFRRNERWRKSKERADDGNSLNSHPPRRPIYVNDQPRVGVCARARAYIFYCDIHTVYKDIPPKLPR